MSFYTKYGNEIYTDDVGAVGIGKPVPISQLDVSGNVRATGEVIASLFSGSGANVTNLNLSAASAGTLAVSYGGIGVTTLSSGKLLVGNGIGGVITPANLTWDNTNSRLGIGKTPLTELDVNGTVTATTFSGAHSGSGAGLNNLNSSNINVGTLLVNYGGIGRQSLNANSVLVGDGTNAVLTPANFVWDNANNRLGIGKNNPGSALDVNGQVTATVFSGSGASLTSLNASAVSSGFLNVAYGGIGVTTLAANSLMVGNGTNGVITPANLTWDSAGSRLDVSGAALRVINPTGTNNTTITSAGIDSKFTNSGNLGASLTLRNGGGSTLGSYTSIFFNLGNFGNLTNAEVRAIVEDANLNTSLVFQTYNGSALTEKVRITGAGNVGIGVTNPSALLHMGNGDIRFDTTSTGGVTPSIAFYDNGSLKSYIRWTGTSNTLTLYSNAETRFTHFANDFKFYGIGDRGLYANGMQLKAGTFANQSDTTPPYYNLKSANNNTWSFQGPFDASANNNLALFYNGSLMTSFGSNANIGIGKTPTSDVALDVSGSVSAASFTGSGVNITGLTANNINAGMLPVSYGGIGVTTITAGRIMVGNGNSAIISSANLTWNNATNTLSATNFTGSGANITGLTANNINAGMLPVSYGGIGVTTITAGRIMVGNGNSAIISSANLTWNNATNTLSATNFTGSGANITGLTANNINAGMLPVSYGGIGVTTITAGRIMVGNGNSAIISSANLTWDNATNTLSATNFTGSGANITNLNMGSAASGTLVVGRGGTGRTDISANKLMVGNGTGGILTPADLHWDATNNRLGIGRTDPSRQMDVSGFVRATAIETNTNDGGYLALNSYWNGSSWTKYASTQGGFIIRGDPSQRVQFYTQDPSSNTITERMTFLYGSGNIGIGKTNPSAMLDVNGIAIFGSTAKIVLGTGMPAGERGLEVYYNLADNYTHMQSTHQGSGHRNLVLNPLGANVGIGKTNPATRLDVNGTVTATSFSGALNATQVNTGTLSVSYGGTGANTLTSGKLLVGNGNGAVLQPSGLTWDNTNSRLGVNNSTPSYALDVGGTTRIQGDLIINGTTTIVDTNVATTERISVTNDGTGPAIIANQLGSQPVVDFQSNSNTAFIINGSGNVGIGKTNPGTALDVSGNVQVSGGVTATALIGSINGSNVNVGTVGVTFGGTGASSFTANSLLVGNGTNPVLAPSALTWDNANGRLAATVFAGSGAQLTSIPLGNTTGTLVVARGGTNTSTLNANKVMIGNGTGGVLTPANLHWDNTNSRLGVGTATPGFTLDVSGSINFSGTLNQGGTQYISSQWTTSGSNLHYTTGNVGIGLTNPSARLDVSHNGTTPALEANQIGTGRILELQKNGTAQVVVDNNGNVGIGKTNPGSALDVNGVATATSFSGALNATQVNAGLLSVAYGGTNTSTLNANKVMIGNGTGGVLTPANLHWDNTNSFLGVGQTNPTYRVHSSGIGTNLAMFQSTQNDVSANFVIQSKGDNNDARTRLLINNAGASNSELKIEVGGSNVAPLSGLQNGSAFIATTNARNLYFGTNNAANMTILSGGNVGIGKTNPGTALDVDGTVTATSLTGALNASNVNAGLLSVAYGGTNTSTLNANKIMVGNGTSGVITPANLHWDNTNSRLGVGTATPSYALDVTTPSRVSQLLVRDSTDTNSVRFISALDASMTNGSFRNITFGKLNSNKNQAELFYYHMADASDNNRFGLGFFGGEVMTLLAGGNVGIGKTNPGSRLDVNGNAQVSGNVTATSFTGALNASNVNAGLLSVAYGGTNTSTLSANKLMVGNGTNGVVTPTNLHWDNTNSRLGLGTATPASTLDVNGNAQVSGQVTATSFVGALNASNVNAGLLSVSYGGTNTSTLNANKVMVGNGTNGVLTPTNLHWDNTNSRLGLGRTNPGTALDVNGTVTATSFVGALNASNVNAGLLSVAYGGTNTSTLNANKVMVGNGTNGVLTPTNLHWDNTNSRLGLGRTNPGTTLDVNGVVNATSFTGALNATQINIGTMAVSYGGTGANTLTSGRVLVGNGNDPVLQPSALTWNNATGTLSATVFSGSGASLDNINGSNVKSGFITVSFGGTGATTLTSGKLLVGNGNGAVLQPTALTWDNTNSRLGVNNTAPGYTLDVGGTARIQGDLIINGTTTIVDTNVATTERISVTNDGTGPAIIANQIGSQPVVDFQVSGTSAFYIAAGGSVGIGKTQPGSLLDVSGTVTALAFSGPLNASSVNSGTLAVSYGGTGATTLSSGSVLVGNGNNAVVTNANFFWDNTNARLGIGKNNPTAPLDVNGNIVTLGTVSLLGSGYGSTWDHLRLVSGSSEATIQASGVENGLQLQVRAGTQPLNSGTYTNVMTLMPSGYVGVGLTNPVATFDISSNNTTAALEVNQTSSGRILDLQKSGTTQVVVDTNGRLGIGLTNPSKQLHISASSDPTLLLQSGGTGVLSGRVSMRQSNLTGYDMYYDGTNGKDYLAFQGFGSGNSQGITMVLKEGKFVGIGITSPVTTLDISSNNTSGALCVNQTSSGRILDLQKNGASQVVVDTSGNVGIGITNPSNKVHVVGGIRLDGETTSSVFPSITVDSGNITNTYITFGAAGTVNDWATLRQIGGSDAMVLALDLHDNGNEGFQIRNINTVNNPDTITVPFAINNGNVGIGITNPSELLDVSGNLRVRGSLILAGATARNTLQIQPVRRKVWIDVSGANPIVLSATGSYQATANDVEIFRNGARLTYVDASFNDYTVSYTFSSPNTFFSINVKTPPKYGDVFDITIWPQLTQQDASQNGTVLQSVNVSTLQWNYQASSPNIYYSAGSVGIGTTDVNNLLEVRGANAAPPMLVRSVANLTGIQLSINTGASNAEYHKGAILFDAGASVGYGIGDLKFCINTDANSNNVSVSDAKMTLTRAGSLGIGTTAPVTRLHVEGGNAYVSGNVGIGITNGSYTLHVVGDIYASGNIIGLSDATKKSNLAPILDPLDKISTLHGYTYDLEGSNKRQTGLIAQEVEQVLPEVISMDQDGIKGISYGNMAGLFVEAIKKLKEEVAMLRQRVQELE
jgi:fibronectin-binding autotransporter adhesin